MDTLVFISHSSKDSKFARAICSALESRGLSCWISSRDVGPGENFMDAIVRAISAAKVMVLVFSANANNSDDIEREIVLASSAKVALFRCVSKMSRPKARSPTSWRPGTGLIYSKIGKLR